MNVEMTAQLRAETGKGPARRARSQEKIPAVLYGPKTQSISLFVPAKRLERLLKDLGEESRLIQLTIEGDGDTQLRQVLIREVQVHPVRRRFLHVDFYEVPLDRAIEVEVPIEVMGESIGVKKGGTLNVIRRTMTVRCLPGEIPEKIPVDVSALDLGGSIRMQDLVSKVPFQLVGDTNFAVVNIEAPEGKADAEEGK